MLALWIILGVLALLGAVGFLPVGVLAVYDADGPEAFAHIGPLKIKLYPKTAEPEPAEEEPAPMSEPKQERQPLGGKLPLFRELLGLVLEAQAEVRNQLRIRELTLYLTVGGKGDDPAKSAVLYGSAWAAIGTLLPLLEGAFQIKSRDIQANVDFLSEETTVYAKADAVISVGTLLRMAAYYGVRGLKLYRKYTKKGGKEYGTSNQ